MFQSAFSVRLALLEELLKGNAPARSSDPSSSKDLEGESAPRLGSPFDEAKTPKPDTTPKAPPRHLEGSEVASASEHTTAREINAPFSFDPLPPPPTLVGLVGPVQIRPTSRPRSHTPSESRQPQPSSTPGGSHPSECGKKRKFGELEPDSSHEELEEDPLSLLRERRGGEAVLGNVTTPPNLPLPSTPSAGLNSRPDFPFNQGSPSPQQRWPPRMTRTPRTPANGDLRHRVPSPVRRPEAQSSRMQVISPLVGEAIPGAPVQMVAVPFRGDHVRRTPEPTSSRAGPSHMVASSVLANRQTWQPDLPAALPSHWSSSHRPPTSAEVPLGLDAHLDMC